MSAAKLGRGHVDAGAVMAARGAANPGNAAGLLRAHEAGPFGIKFLISRTGP